MTENKPGRRQQALQKTKNAYHKVCYKLDHMGRRFLGQPSQKRQARATMSQDKPAIEHVGPQDISRASCNVTPTSSTNPAKAKSTSPDFPQFGLLPPEIRQYIWALAIPPRLVHITTMESSLDNWIKPRPTYQDDIESTVENMAVAQASEEARWVVENELRRAYRAAANRVVKLSRTPKWRHGKQQSMPLEPPIDKDQLLPLDPDRDTLVMDWQYVKSEHLSPPFGCVRSCVRVNVVSRAGLELRLLLTQPKQVSVCSQSI